MTDTEYQARLDSIISNLNKDLGKGSLMRSTSIPEEVDVIPTGIIGIDKALGIGGIPRGRITEMYGPESCLTGDKFLQYRVCDSEGRKRNSKGGTLERLYERFNRLAVRGQGKYQRSQSVDSMFTIPSMIDEGGIFHNYVENVLRMGRKQVYRVETVSGICLKATANHPFFTGEGYTFLEDLKEGDTLYVHDRYGKGRLVQANRQETTVKYHPRRPTKDVNGYRYYRIPLSHLAYEAEL